MTDGTPTVGVTEEPRIHTDVTKARQQGEAEIAINIIGFGAGISHSFLSRIFNLFLIIPRTSKMYVPFEISFE